MLHTSYPLALLLLEANDLHLYTTVALFLLSYSINRHRSVCNLLFIRVRLDMSSLRPKKTARFFSRSAVKSVAFCRHNVGQGGGGPRPLIFCHFSLVSFSSSRRPSVMRTPSSPYCPVTALHTESSFPAFSSIVVVQRDKFPRT